MRRENRPPPRRLYHTASIEENREFKDAGLFKKGNTDPYKDDGGLARMSSATMVGIRSFLETFPSKPLEVDAGAPIQQGPIGGG